MMRALWCAAVVLGLSGCESTFGGRRAAAAGDAVPTAGSRAAAAGDALPTAGSRAVAAGDAVPTAQTPAVQRPRAPVEATALHTPAKGSPERAAILDAIRPWTENELGQPVIFSIDHLAVKDGYAFMSGSPLQPDGKPIDYRKTRFRKDLEEGVFSGNLSALVRRTDTGWTLLASSLGATDVPWVSWPADHGAPKEIFPGPID